MAELILEIVEGPQAGRQVDLAGPLDIGRTDAAGLRLDDDQVSRHHARVSPANGGVVVEDLGSTNGTFVNGHEIHAPTRADPGDELLVGVTVFQVRTRQDVTRQPSAVRPVPPPLATPARRPDFLPPDVGAGGPETSELDPLLDVYTKAKARAAPIAIFAVVVLAVIIFLATR